MSTRTAKSAEVERLAGKLYDVLETPEKRAHFLMKQALKTGGTTGQLANLNASRGPRW